MRFREGETLYLVRGHFVVAQAFQLVIQGVSRRRNLHRLESLRHTSALPRQGEEDADLAQGGLAAFGGHCD
ncbi:MAG: hypothetical protein NTW86_12850 [Candidatus Sumerlaeota bacterium]|nr:hypothetical protein [Candidatus Sumerlaeota bacterium]